MIRSLPQRVHGWLDGSRQLDFIAPLLLRLFLAPVFISAGLNKLLAFDSTVEWFGNADWGLGLPLPWLMAFLAVATELLATQPRSILRQRKGWLRVITASLAITNTVV